MTSPSANNESLMSRRQFVRGTAGATAAWAAGGMSLASLVAGCSGSSSTDAASGSATAGAEPTTANTTATGGTTGEGPYLQALFPDGNRQPTIMATESTQRAIVALTEGTGPMGADNVPETLALTLISPTGEATPVTTTVHHDQIPDHYYPVEFLPERPGWYELSTEVDGSLSSVKFQVVPPTEATLVQIGDVMRPADTPTFDDNRGVFPICTRTPEPCPFHEMNLADVIGNGKPTALLISTPGFCQTGICGPTLEILISAAEDFPDINYIHAEVYTEPQLLVDLPPSELVSPTVEIYGMVFEPGMVIADADGIVTDRLDIVMDGVEMRSALERAMG